MAKQLFGIGTKVKFLTTPDSGTIIDKLGDGMVMVQLDGVDIDIPAFEEDLIRAEDFTAQTIDIQSINPKNIVKTGKLIAVEAPASTEFDPLSIKSVFKNSGVHLAFLPIKKRTGEIEKFDILLINDTPFDIVFALDFVLFDDIQWSKEGILKPVKFEKIGEVVFDDARLRNHH